MTAQASSFPVPQFAVSDRRQRLASTFQEIEQIFKTFMEQNRAPGLAFGIIIDGELAYSNAFGWRNLADQAPATPESVFRIASMSKSITAMCVVKLRDEGILQLDKPVQEYVPELATLPYPTTDSAPITVRQLLTMSTGFPQDDPWADRQLAVDRDTLSEWLSRGVSFSNPPGITFEYSNYGYGILGRVITNVSGMPYQAYATRHIFEPLGMTDTTYDVSRVPTNRLAMGYRLEGGTWQEELPLPDGEFGAMGGILTTIPDFARYMALLMSAFPARHTPDDGSVRRSSLREMQQFWRPYFATATRNTPDAPLIIQSVGYGYGLRCTTDSVLGYSVAHGGGLPGYGTFYRLLPDCGVGIVAFTNLTYTPAAIPVDAALTVMKNAGGLTVRVLPASAALSTLRDGIVRLYEQWDDSAVKALSTESFFLDMPLDKRREQFERLRAELGKPLSTTNVQPENALRGRWTIHCERGSIECFATMSPTIPPAMQVLQLTVAKPLTPKLRHMLTKLLRLIRSWDRAAFRVLFVPPIKPALTQTQLHMLHTLYGALQLKDVLEGDGQTWARVRIASDRGALDLRLTLDAHSGKIREMVFTKPIETPFML